MRYQIMSNRIIIFFLVFLLIGCSAANSTQPTAVPTEDSQAPDDISPEEASIVYDIVSESGIGSETFQRPEQGWSAEVVLRFHLQGLEEMHLMYADTAVVLNIASTGQNDLQQTVSGNGQSQSINTADPNWMSVSVLNEAGTPGTIPLKNGTINVRLPTAFYEENPESFTVNWIDFYR